MYELLRILFVIVTFFLTVECKEISCIPSQPTKLETDDLICEDCVCNDNGDGMSCVDSTCITPIGATSRLVFFNKGHSCNPADAIPTYVGRDMTCDDCSCEDNGKALICAEGSCIRPDGSQVENEWGAVDLPVVKRCNFGMYVFDKCNLCMCDRKQKPSLCTIIDCSKNLINKLMLNNPRYPLK
ncbi:uncharacterized protein LOC108738525 isoform X2 [Agrilus planipennis]|uniref:Uncharacterized protein LOC108738525 isoform X2 n=1 Tax=Agrilus planipennis TaxID=224129 RepID=A0A7F5RDD8_AGRPL|nr:uncharacterized protein LOC108738525 isoform X2 [Agrilus planipennis]